MTFEFSGALYRFVDYQRTVRIEEAEGGTLSDCIDALTDRYPALRRVLLDGEGLPGRSHLLYINGEPTGDRQEAMARPLSASDEVYVLTAITGG